ncbi:hypothetical protein EVAR_15683_1 [Eumeta japonica]|uniref:Reverse transcriptase domain-containing protein n=1 Tax=Eumeta variegata TaxID=151549 RepID=A0A4C1U9L3_EUMVA|nr:hypothetical protein EVAR_15683_1 [Eumeta japonica]
MVSINKVQKKTGQKHVGLCSKNPGQTDRRYKGSSRSDPDSSFAPDLDSGSRFTSFLMDYTISKDFLNAGILKITLTKSTLNVAQDAEGRWGIVASLLYQLFDKYWKNRMVLNDRCKGVIVPLYKGKGSRQRCVALQWLFNLFMGSYLCGLKEYECELRIDELSFKCFLSTDDQIILVPSAFELQAMINKMNDSIKKSDMKESYNGIGKKEDPATTSKSRG